MQSCSSVDNVRQKSSDGGISESIRCRSHRSGIVCAKDGKYLSASSFFGGNNQAKSSGVGSGAREQGVNVAGAFGAQSIFAADTCHTASATILPQRRSRLLLL